MLVANANRVVSADRLAEELWPEMAPDRAANNLQVRLSELRKALRSAGEEDRLVTRAPGYVLRVGAGDLDALRFDELVAAGRASLAAGDPAVAEERLGEALGLWRGPALADVRDAPFARAEAARLEEARLSALESRLDAQLGRGGGAELVAELEALTAAYPLRERFWSQRMLALYRARRQADALRAYRDLRAVLVEELAIEPSPELRELEARILRQDSTLLYGRRHETNDDRTAAPETQYGDSAGVHIAYQVLGTGELDIVFVPGLISHLDLWWEDPTAARFFRRLAALGRLIMYDKRDTGLSDSAPRETSLEHHADDLHAVMRACKSSSAVLFGYSEGSPTSILFAATHPERVRGLILGAAFARCTPAPDYPCGPDSVPPFEAIEHLATHRWGLGESVEWYAPSRAHSRRARAGFARWERMAASPSSLLRVSRMIRAIDVRSVLPAVEAPTLVIQRSDDLITRPCHGRYLADHLPHARYFEQPGDHLLWLGDTDAMLTEIEVFLTGARQSSASDGVLATILLTDIGDSTAAAARMGDRRWHSRLDIHHATARREVGSHHGRLIKKSGDGILATFDGPGRAITCAYALREAASEQGIQIRAGLHTGEIELLDDDIAGMSVHIAARINSLARPGEILVSRTVKDLVVGSAISFTDRGTHNLSGVPEDWDLFAVAGI
jgi:DNA-binding SARP family transcriptional activator/class 3 adenylate cyclase/alpha-beta hydrolase superfamily lysophospholipase